MLDHIVVEAFIDAITNFEKVYLHFSYKSIGVKKCIREPTWHSCEIVMSKKLHK